MKPIPTMLAVILSAGALGAASCSSKPAPVPAAEAKRPAAKVTIEGHCDERGTAQYNMALGERRAASVREYLVQLGVGSSRIQIVSYGKERPFVTGHDESAWSQNRRGHFVVTAN